MTYAPTSLEYWLEVITSSARDLRSEVSPTDESLGVIQIWHLYRPAKRSNICCDKDQEGEGPTGATSPWLILQGSMSPYEYNRRTPTPKPV